MRRLELVEGAPDDLRAALAHGDRALNFEGDLRASRKSFERAYDLAEQANDAPAMGLAALGLAGLWVSERRTMTGAAMLETRLERVLAMLDERSSLALRIRTRLAAEADYRSGEHAAILSLLDEARAAADPVPLAEALSLAHHCLLGPSDVAVRRELAVEMIKQSFRTKRRSDLLMGLMWRTVDSYSEGDHRAGRFLGELRDHLGEREHYAVGFIVSAIEVMLAIRAGRLDEAESLVQICAKNGASAGDIDSEWWPGAQLVTIRWYQDRLDELLPALTERVHSPALSAVDNSAISALAVAAAHAGDQRTAASCLAIMRGRDLAELPRSSSWLVTMAGVVEAAYLIEDADISQQAYDLLRPYAHLPMVGGLGVTCLGSTHQALGIAALTTRDLDRAIDHLRTAVQYNLALPHWPALVLARQRLARAYELRGRLGDAEAAKRAKVAADGEAAVIGLPVAGSGDSRSGGGALAECGRVGRKWRITLGDRTVLVEHSIGMVHLAVLTANPRQDIPAADLAAGLAGLVGSAGRGAGQPVLDRLAIDAYRNRLAQLDAQLGLDAQLDTEPGDLQPADDQDRAVLARAERGWLTAQLAGATGLAGRTRSFPDEGERARVAVGKAIRRALVRIADADAVIGQHLREAVHTGARCSYWPA
jgi:tetratricopeptide (TPR) repeat protein